PATRRSNHHRSRVRPLPSSCRARRAGRARTPGPRGGPAYRPWRGGDGAGVRGPAVGPAATVGLAGEGRADEDAGEHGGHAAPEATAVSGRRGEVAVPVRRGAEAGAAGAGDAGGAAAEGGGGRREAARRGDTH